MWLFLSIVNIILAHFAEKNYKGNKRKCKLFLFLIVVVNAIIIGLRDIGVGIDTLVYIEYYFHQATDIHSIKAFLYNDNSNLDKGFLFLSWVSTLFGDDPRILLFITELFIISLCCAGIYEYKKKLNFNITYFVLLFILILQHETINMMRQFCAMSLLFYGYSLFLQKKITSYLVCQTLAYFFHTSSFVFLLLPSLYIILRTRGIVKYICTFAILIIFGFFAFQYYHILQYIQALGVLKESYIESYEVTDMGYKTILSPHFLMRFLVYIIEMIICYILYVKKVASNSFVYLVFILCNIKLLITLSTLNVVYFDRIGFYYSLVLMILFSMVANLKKRKLQILCFAYAFAYMLIILRLYYVNSVENNCFNLAYTSKFLGIN